MTMWKYFLFKVLFLFGMSVLAGGADEPKWFPDLMCHQGAMKDNVNILREQAKECNNLDKDDPCLRFCIFQKWRILLNGKFEFCSKRLARFITSITNDEDHVTQLRRGLGKCVENVPSYLELKFKGKPIPQSTMCRQPAFDCIEAIMNCSTIPVWYITPPTPSKLFVFPCHPEYTGANAMFDVMQAENFCLMLFKSNRVCQMVCATHGYPKTGNFLVEENTFFRYMNKYVEASKQNDTELMITAKLFLTNTLGEGGSLRGEVTNKIITHCLDLWVSTSNLDWEYCEEEQAQWEPFVKCLDDVFNCKV